MSFSFRPLGTEVPRHRGPAGTKGAHRHGGRGRPGGPEAGRHREGEDRAVGIASMGGIQLGVRGEIRLGLGLGLAASGKVGIQVVSRGG